MQKRMVFLFIMIILCSITIIPAMADPYDSDVSIETLVGEDAGAKTASVDNIKGYVDKKGGDIISLLQYIAQPVLIIAFLLFAFLAVFGMFGNGSLVGRGVFGMLLCGVSYSLVLYADEIMTFISKFLAP